jgi:hypothetical protein
MPLTATGQYDVEVGRLRKSLVFGDYGLEFFVSGDQLLRGPALNAVLVAEEMAKNGALEEAKSILVYSCLRCDLRPWQRLNQLVVCNYLILRHSEIYI